jgi:hypothetical protein
LRASRVPERSRKKVPIADDMFESHPTRMQVFNQKRNLAVDSLQIQRAAKVTTSDDCSEAQPMAAVRALDRGETSG